MTSNDQARSLLQQMQECFNTRQFDRADDLFTPDFINHTLGATGVESGKNAWRTVVAQFPDARVVAQDILVDGDKASTRSTVKGIATSSEDPEPMLIEIFRIEHGRLAETWGVGNLPWSATSLS